jgi:hypothetical protein
MPGYICKSLNVFHMKKRYLTLSLLLASAVTFAQPTTGMIGHWDMNGTGADSSGGGHNGHMNNLTAAAGQDGVAGHAWYFNGINSALTLPYFSALNVSQFTISAVINVKGFYTGPCHGNTLFIRGRTNSAGSYFLDFTDYPAGFGCTTAIDTNQESFMAAALDATGSGLLVPPPFTIYNDTPHVALNQWYNVVTTFDGAQYKIYVNELLRTTAPNPTPAIPMGTSIDSAAIGFAPYDNAVGYPYGFKGIIDDIKLYNTALSPCDVAKLTYWVSSLITAQPVNDTAGAGGTATYAIADTGVTGTYQWQVNTGVGGFTNCPASAPYSGVTTKTLTVTPVTAAMNNYQYRCLRNSGTGCVDTSANAKLVISKVGIANMQQQDIAIMPNPAGNIVSITTAIAMDKIEIMDVTGRKIITEHPGSTVALLDISTLTPGMYLVRINDNFTSRFIKE